MSSATVTDDDIINAIKAGTPRDEIRDSLRCGCARIARLRKSIGAQHLQRAHLPKPVVVVGRQAPALPPPPPPPTPRGDTLVRGTVFVWGSDEPTPQLPVRCLEDELTPDITPPKTRTTCMHCNGALATDQGRRAMFCSAGPCVAAALRRRRAMRAPHERVLK